MNYSTSTPVTEAVEVRLTSKGGAMALTAWRDPTGTVAANLLRGTTPVSLSTLQSRAPFPGKAVPGWQAEVVAFCEAGIFSVTEVR